MIVAPVSNKETDWVMGWFLLIFAPQAIQGIVASNSGVVRLVETVLPPLLGVKGVRYSGQ